MAFSVLLNITTLPFTATARRNKNCDLFAGLWIGVSAITACEVFELIVRLSYNGIAHVRAKMKNRKETDDYNDSQPIRSNFGSMNSGLYSTEDDFILKTDTQYAKYDYT